MMGGRDASQALAIAEEAVGLAAEVISKID
jgi:hypothetical protein